MTRRLLFVLLALGLPTAALASSISYDTGKFKSGTISGTFTTSLSATEVGSLDTIRIDTGTLTKLSQKDCAKGFTCYDFSGGSVTVMHDGSTIFTDSLTGGLVKTRGDVTDIIANLKPDAKVAQGTAVATLDWRKPHERSRSGEHHPDHSPHNRHERGKSDKHHAVHGGSIDVSLAAVATPEPGTLGLLGAGLIGLAGLTRRKLKF